jgi:hypothetical protein
MTGKSDYQPIRKPHHRWLYYSLTVALLWLSAVGFEAVALFLGSWEFPIPFRIALLALILVPAFVLVMAMVMGTRIFTWRYSIFGPYERTPPPKGFQPHIQMSIAPGQPHFIEHFAVGREGLELTFCWNTLFFRKQTRAFLPAAAITAIGPAAWRTYVIEHDSAEFESPLVVSQEVGEAILAGLNPKLPQGI